MEIELAIQGMTCASCATHVERALDAVPGVEEARVPGWESGRAKVIASSNVAADALVSAVEGAGYRAAVVERPQDPENRVLPRELDGSGLFVRPDLLIIGGGSAGVAAAIRGAELGREVTLVEAGTIGGTCVNVGCVPSKTLLAAMARYEHAADQPFDGVSTSAGRLAWSRVVAQKEALVAQLRQEKYVDVLAHYPSIRLVRGEARFVDDERVAVGEKLYHPGTTIIATGARPAIPPIPGLDTVPYLDSTAALALRAVPDSLVVIGGGAIGVELAQLFARAGSAVTVVEMLPTLLPTEERALGEALAAELAAEGVRIESGARVTSVEAAARGTRVYLERDGDTRVVEGSHLLVAVGRRPNTGRLGLDAAGVEVDAQGAVVVDGTLQSTNPRIFAAGDVAGTPQYVYVAAAAGGLAASNALRGDGVALDLSGLPRVTFTDPAVASVGLTEEQAREAGHEPMVTTVPLKMVPRALANRDTRGLIKLVADPESRRLLGAHILAPQAGEMLQPAVIAILHGLTVDQLRDTYFPYLTMVEGIKLALVSFEKEVATLSCCAV